MEEYISEIQQNPYFGLVMSAITIASILYAIYANRSSKKYKYIDHYGVSTKLFWPADQNDSDLHLFYKNEEIPDATITNVAIWNAGNEAVRGDEMADFLTLDFGDESDEEEMDSDYNNSILNANIIGATNKNNGISISEKSNHWIKLDFKFLNPGDGFVIQIVHTGYPLNLKVHSDVIDERRRLRNLQRGKRDHIMNLMFHDFLRGFTGRMTKAICALTTALFIFWVVAKIAFPTVLGNDAKDIKIVTVMICVFMALSWFLFFVNKASDKYNNIPESIRKILHMST